MPETFESPGGVFAGRSIGFVKWSWAINERYAVLNVVTGKIIGPWFFTEAAARAAAVECNVYETQLNCEVVRFCAQNPEKSL